MNEISFKDFNKSLANNTNYNTQTIETKSKTKTSPAVKHSNTSTISVGAVRSTKQLTETSEKKPFIPAGINSTTKTIRKTVADNNLIPYDNERDTLYSTWTPLSDENTNNKLYKERKQLFLKWFETWNESQRRQAIGEMLGVCHPRQLFFARDEINKISPIYQIDFTRILPRVICLYIFSFLDPRSLCRCAQVCWYWKMLTEADQLWVPKCLRFGWNLNYIPTSFENGIWKQFYIENIKSLQYVPVKKPDTPPISTLNEVNLHDLSYGRFGFNKFMRGNRSLKSSAGLKQPPWKANNSNPNHFYRFNYLDQDENQIKQQERLLKSLALDSVQAKRPRSSARSSRNKPNSATTTTNLNKHEHNALNKSIENLITEGQHLLEQIKISSTNDPTNNTVKPQQVNNSKHETSIASLSSKDRSDSIPKQLWNLLDDSES